MSSFFSILRPEFFDIFGIGVFGFITGLALWASKTSKPLPRWAIRLLLVIGILGLLVDGVIVYRTYLR